MQAAPGSALILRQLFDAASSTYTYLLGDRTSGEALVIDPVLEHWQRDSALLGELGLRPVATLETHVHADHVTGAWWLRRALGCQIAVSARAGTQGADRLLQPDERIAFGDRHLQVRATPGHTHGCITFVLDDSSVAFTGDCLLIRGTGRADFQQGDSRALFRSIRDQIFTLPGHCLLYPAHDYRGLTVTSVDEEHRLNPRVADAVGEDDFVGYMNNLNLPHPKLLDIAIPANLRLGAPADPVEEQPGPKWAPLRFTVAGIWEIEPSALAELHCAGAADRCAHAGGILRTPGTYPRRTPDPARAPRRPGRRLRPRCPARHGVPQRRPLCTGGGAACQGGLHAGGEPGRRHAALDGRKTPRRLAARLPWLTAERRPGHAAVA